MYGVLFARNQVLVKYFIQNSCFLCNNAVMIACYLISCSSLNLRNANRLTLILKISMDCYFLTFCGKRLKCNQ